MRLLTVIITLALFPLAMPSHRGNGEAVPALQCPTVRVSCADTVRAGDETKFTAEVVGTDAELAYSWQVSAGTIVRGQGTSSVSVDTTGVGGQTLKATVEVTGFPEACARRAECETSVMGEIIGDRLDVYGKITFEDEKARLDNFAIELQNDPTSQGYLLCYGGRVGEKGEARRRCERAKNYMATVRGIDASRIVVVDGGYMEKFMVWLWVVPSGATPPAASPTVDPREVHFIKDHRPKRRRHR